MSTEGRVDLPISQVLPGRLMHAALKADVIAWLHVAPLPGARKRKLFRRWCEYVNAKCRREDLALVAPTREPQRQESLPL